MISHSELSEILGEDAIKMLGFSKDYFFSLPIECQNDLMKRFFVTSFIKNKKGELKIRKEEFKKRMALAPYNFEEEIKEKVLKIVKKNK